MRQNKYRYKLAFLGICIVIFCTSVILNRAYFQTLEYENVFWYQIRQMLCIMTLYLMGWLLLKIVRHDIPTAWIYLLAFPVGMCVWGLEGIILLLLQIPFRPVTMLIATLIVFLCFGAVKKFKILLWEDAEKETGYWCIVAACALLVSCGWTYVILSYDSFYFFMNYGQALARLGNWSEFMGENSFVLTHIGQFLPVLNGLTAFWQIEQSYQIQAFMALNLLFIFGTALYEAAGQGINDKKNRYFCTMSVLLLATSTCFIFSSSWVLANAYCMFFLFLFFILTSRMKLGQKLSFDYMLVLTLLSASLALLRKDGFLFASFCILGVLLKDIDVKSVYLIFMPGMFLEAIYIWYVRSNLSIAVEYAQESSIQNDSNILLMAAGVAGILIYALVRKILLKIWKWEEWIFLLLMFLLMNLGILVLMPTRTIDNVDDLMKNLFLLPSSSGLSVYIYIVLLCFCIGGRGMKCLNFNFYYFTGYLLLMFCAYNVAKNSWVNIDDSNLRVLLQIAPVLVYWLCSEMRELLLQPDRRNDV